MSTAAASDAAVCVCCIVCFQVHGHTQFPLTVQWDITSIDGQKIATRTLQLSEMYRNAYNMQFIPALKNDSHYKRRLMNAFGQLTKTKKRQNIYSVRHVKWVEFQLKSILVVCMNNEANENEPMIWMPWRASVINVISWEYGRKANKTLLSGTTKCCWHHFII